MSLHAAMIELSLRTMRLLEAAKTAAHQPLEETITDLNILGLRQHWPSLVKARVHTKPEEGVSGADWEWWFVNSTNTHGTRVLVQAKVVSLDKDSFPMLHYRSSKTGIYQSDKLIATAKKSGAYPLICLYTDSRNVYYSGGKKTFSDGCMVMTASDISHLRNSSKRLKRTKSALTPYWLPLPLLFCDCDDSVAASGITDLAYFVSQKLWTRFNRQHNPETEPLPPQNLPAYVLDILALSPDGTELESYDLNPKSTKNKSIRIPEKLRGVLVFTSSADSPCRKQKDI